MLRIDLHTHTVFSGHAFGTIYEIAAEAARKNMQMIAFTDHGPSMSSVISPLHFMFKHRFPEYINGVRTLYGCEANILNESGELDIDEEIQKDLDILLAAIHLETSYVDLSLDGNTRAVINALKNPHLKVLSHPAHPYYPCQLETILNTAIDNHVLLELNTSYLRSRPNEIPSVKSMVDLVKNRGAKLLVNSDTHFVHEVGDDDALYENWNALDMNEELIINNYPDELCSFLGIKI
ncbi:MAG: PHP domain-containing protein [Deltaproteobacteria bacterium]|nr:PHP domain-containing protein [Deltaproteobacteria bacterium]